MPIESQALEFKRLWEDDYLRAICSFANDEGGRLLLGPDDGGEVVCLNCKTLIENLREQEKVQLQGVLNAGCYVVKDN